MHGIQFNLINLCLPFGLTTWGHVDQVITTTFVDITWLFRVKRNILFWEKCYENI